MAATKCPECGAPTAWEGNDYRPFCSDRCRLLDLQGWLGERYAIPGEPVPSEPAREDGASEGDAPAGARDGREARGAKRARRNS
ncbi:MAG TPA: DNA gyrase inhibitor YacG [Candidatus Binatia bacterium]|nr:DNA gyrase inhibitor YacG [Candidatus Binatia bacterium]